MVADALRDFSFRLLGPGAAAGEDGCFHVERRDGSCVTLLEPPGCSLDPYVVDFGAADDRLRRLLGPLLAMPRMGRLAYAGILNTLVREMDPDHAFVNVGVWHGFSLLAAMAGNEEKVCVGIDNFSQFGGPRDAFLQRFLRRRSTRHRFHNQDYEDFFAAGLERPLGVYFYDGAHEYEHQYRGLMNAEPFYDDDAVVVVDDVNWHAPREATLQFAQDSRLDWTLVLDQPTASGKHPTLWNGVMVLQAGAGDVPPLRLVTRDELTVVPDVRDSDASLSVVLVGEHAEVPDELREFELLRTDGPDSVPAAVEASTGAYLVVLGEGADVSGDGLRQAVAEHRSAPAQV